jgi:hypothetical protein
LLARRWRCLYFGDAFVSGQMCSKLCESWHWSGALASGRQSRHREKCPIDCWLWRQYRHQASWRHRTWPT